MSTLRKDDIAYLETLANTRGLHQINSQYAGRLLAILQEGGGDVGLWTKQLERLERFRACMVDKLQQNLHKGDWSRHGFKDLLSWLRQEVIELEDELDREDGEIVPAKVAAEAADVANFALMIADNAGGLS